MHTSKITTEQLNTHINVGESTSTASTTKWINELYDNGPTFIRGNEEKGYFATLGNYRITIPYKYKEDLEDELKACSIGTVISTFIAMLEQFDEYKKISDELQKQQDKNTIGQDKGTEAGNP